MKNAADFLAIGQEVNHSGFIATVVSFYNEQMVVIRLQSGTCVLDFRDLKLPGCDKFIGR